MTDEQIIIDGIDVSGCEYYDKNKSSLTCTCEEYSCSECYNCYYKQLKAKEQSEARLVKQIQIIFVFINNHPEIFKGIYGGVDKIITEYAECKEQECEKLKKQNKMLSQNNSVQQWCDMYNQKDKECFNALLKLGYKQQALDEIEEYVKNQLDGFGNDAYNMDKSAINSIQSIINKAKEK